MTATADAPRATGTQAVDRACALAAMIVRDEAPVTFSEACESSGLARATTSRLLSALERQEFLQRDADGAYVAGPIFALYSSRHDPYSEMARVAEPHLQRLRNRCEETTHLAVPWGIDTRHVAQVDSGRLLGTGDWSETYVPPHCSSLGKVLYAYERIPFPEGRLEPCTAHSVRTHEDLRRDMSIVRRRGWSITIDELEVGLSALGAPVFGVNGDVIAALGISAPTVRIQDRIIEMSQILVDEAARLSRAL